MSEAQFKILGSDLEPNGDRSICAFLQSGELELRIGFGWNFT